MKIGLDLDGTVYSYPEFFKRLIEGCRGIQFYCISSHGRNEWSDDMTRLNEMGIPAYEISPLLMHHERHGDLSIKGKAADKCDIVFDDDIRLKDYTKTPVFVPMRKV